MYFIVNATKSELGIGDLGIVIGPHKSMDLDRIKDRNVINRSKDLKTAIRKGFIKVKQVTPMEGSKIEIEASATVGEEEVNKIREAVRKEVQDEMKKQQITSAMPEGITDMLSQIKGMLENQGQKTQIIHHHTGKQDNDEDSDFIIDEKTLTDIHAKAQKKLVKGTESKVNYNESKTKGNVSKNVDELDDLLG